MTYGNIQEIRVTAGPLQHLLGLADVEVQAAGGGGEKHDRKGHVGHFEGVSNAAAIRDLIVERLRHYRDSGLGDAPVVRPWTIPRRLPRRGRCSRRQARFGDFWLRIRQEPDLQSKNGRGSCLRRLHGPVY